MTGATEKTLKKAGIPYDKTYTHSHDHAAYYPGAEMIAIKLLSAPETGRLLGAQAVGKAGLAKRIDVLAMAIQKQATVFDLEGADLSYAPQYGSARDREFWVHCGLGKMSYYACRMLKQKGFRIRNLSGGMKTDKTMQS